MTFFQLRESHKLLFDTKKMYDDSYELMYYNIIKKLENRLILKPKKFWVQNKIEKYTFWSKMLREMRKHYLHIPPHNINKIVSVTTGKSTILYNKHQKTGMKLKVIELRGCPLPRSQKTKNEHTVADHIQLLIVRRVSQRLEVNVTARGGRGRCCSGGYLCSWRGCVSWGSRSRARISGWPAAGGGMRPAGHVLCVGHAAVCVAENMASA